MIFLLNLHHNHNPIQVSLDTHSLKGCSFHPVNFYFPGYHSLSELWTALTLFYVSVPWSVSFIPFPDFLNFKWFISTNNLKSFDFVYYDTPRTHFPELVQCILTTKILSPGFIRPFAVETLITPQGLSLILLLV